MKSETRSQPSKAGSHTKPAVGGSAQQRWVSIKTRRWRVGNQKREISPAALGLNQNPPLAGQNLSSVLCRLSSVVCLLSSVVCLLAMLLGGAGCESASGGPGLTGPATKTDDDFKRLSVYSHFAPAKVNIMPLTEFISPGDARQANINLYVSLLDSFGSQIKSPCVFRFELYQKVQRSSEPKGKRVIIWPDIDLTDLVENDEYWRDFLRAYEFNLPFEFRLGQTNQSYILQVTSLCPTGRRLSDEFVLNPMR
jgi:hypothetical protein